MVANGFSIGEVLKDAMPVIIDTVVYGVCDIGKRFVNNYDKRRDVDFTPTQSIKGSFVETKNYYCDTTMGRTPVEDTQAVYFMNHKRRKF